jgi:multidrug efflux pump subunit AcrA (membrane-fusion protein)
LEETLALLPDLRTRIRKKGWYLQGEVQSALIVLILLSVVWLAGFSIVPEVPPGFSIPLPGLGLMPGAGDVFPSNIPGDTSGNPGDTAGGDSGGSDLSSDELGDVGEVLQELGENLSENAATADLGKALEQGNLDQAAEELQGLAGNLDQLSPDTLDEFSEDLANAADQLQEPGQQDLADALDNASKSVQEGDSAQAGESLDTLAEELQAVAQQAASEPNEGDALETAFQDGATQQGAGSGGSSEGDTANSGAPPPQSGDSEDFERLDGEGETFDLAETGETQGYLKPGIPPEDISDEVVGGVFDFVGSADPSIISGIFDPIDLPIAERDVISSYFGPR